MTNAVLSRERKAKMLARTKEYFSTYENYMLLNIQKVKSTQFKDIAGKFPPQVKLLFAKNKIIRKVLRELDEKKYASLLDSLVGNVIVAFFDGANPRSVLEASEQHLRPAFAEVGDVAKKDVVVPAGPTGLAPEKISIFQASRINTKINKGKIDVASDHVLVAKGERVGISDSNLLKMLGIMPFEFGMDIMKVYEDGEVYSKDILLIDESCIGELLSDAASSVAAVSLGLGITTEASLAYEVAAARADIEKVALGLGINVSE